MGEKSKNEMLSFLRYLLEEFKQNPDVFPYLRIDIERKIEEIEDPLNEIFIDDEEILKELGKYLNRKGWGVLLIEEEGILKGDEGKKNSFRLSFKFIGKKK